MVESKPLVLKVSKAMKLIPEPEYTGVKEVNQFLDAHMVTMASIGPRAQRAQHLLK